MKFSENWLRQHVGIDATRDELAATLTAIGLEVEDMTVLGEALDGVVVARIVECAKHPEADRLQVCQVDAGQGALLQIVCGAPNARPGLCAPLATVGAKVGDITIRAAKLRGVESNGMLCSAKELGLDADASGLFELPSDAPVGSPLAEYLALPDASIELKLTPNRADCFSVRGIAFDVAAACGSAVVPLDATPMPALVGTQLDITLQAGADAPRYVGRVIDGVDAARTTPIWMAATASRWRPSGQPAGRCHPVRHARNRPANARLRSRPAAWADRCAPRTRCRDIDPARWARRGTDRRFPAGHGRRSSGWARRRDGRFRYACHCRHTNCFPRSRAFRA
jgi:phenylalanyl-tRNA synthetase beta chain